MRDVFFCLMLLACGNPERERLSAVDSGDTGTDADAGVDRALVTACVTERWIQQTCSGCHLEGSHIDLRYDALETLLTTDREFHPGPIVIPGNPDESLLVRKVEARVGLVTLSADEGGPMPLDTEIDADDAQLVREWVALGAVLPEGC